MNEELGSNSIVYSQRLLRKYERISKLALSRQNNMVTFFVLLVGDACSVVCESGSSRNQNCRIINTHRGNKNECWSLVSMSTHQFRLPIDAKGIAFFCPTALSRKPALKFDPTYTFFKSWARLVTAFRV
jgi:hypothetical protein